MSRAINGVANEIVYDSRGRVTVAKNPISGFSYGYDGVTSRITGIEAEALRTSYDYYDNLKDRRLMQITNFGQEPATVSTFIYNYWSRGKRQWASD